MALSKDDIRQLRASLSNAQSKCEMEAIMEKMPSRFRKVVRGVAENDSPHVVSVKVNGLFFQHRAYAAWTKILSRVYDPSYLNRNPTYRDCGIDERWLKFSAFEAWWKENYVEGYSLDKDLLTPGNKIYSPETCVYIPQSLNVFALDSSSYRGEWTVGVSWNARKRLYQATIHNFEGRIKCLGYRDNPEDAHQLWLKEKNAIANKLKPLCDSIHPKLFEGILTKIEMLSEGK